MQSFSLFLLFLGNAKSNSCPPHPGFLHGLCIRCGFLKPSDELNDERNVALRYIHAVSINKSFFVGRPCLASLSMWILAAITSRLLQGLEVSSLEAERIRSNELEKILSKRKLYLVLDLDHTLLNSARFVEVTFDEDAYLRSVYLDVECLPAPAERGSGNLLLLHSYFCMDMAFAFSILTES